MNCTQYVLPDVELTVCADSLCTVSLASFTIHAVLLVAFHARDALVIYPASLVNADTFVGTVGTAHPSTNVSLSAHHVTRCQLVGLAGNVKASCLEPNAESRAALSDGCHAKLANDTVLP